VTPGRFEAPVAPWEEEDVAARFALARRVAMPLVLGGMLLLAFTPLRFLLTLCSAMWLHELGHAMTAWFCGSVAIPLPWVTYGGETRSASLVVLEFFALGAWGWFRRAHLPLVGALAALLLLGVVVSERTMQMWMVFGGDGGALVLGTVLMLSVFLPDHVRLSRGGLRWGFLGLGAASFAATFATWFDARRDPGTIPFGHIDGVGLSDPSKLVDVYGWTERALVNRYLGLAGACLAVLALAQLVAFRARRTS